MTERDRRDPYPADQQFGAAAAEDQETVDAMGEDEAAAADGGRDRAPRAANKAEPA